ncbi:MAG: hypothetical protein H7Z16_17395 [Pyrinomonadaceae bacterium]|nr:hypothetical protein [Pyrinomonadaceae bacterium]
MGKYERRYALWKHHRGRCFWCDEPVGFQEFEIDHFIPERLEDNPSELSKVRADFGLSASFVINDYCNWLPSHRRCNQKKGGRIPKLTLHAIETLDKLARDAETIRSIEREIEQKFRDDKRFAQAMVGIKAGLNTNKFTKDQKDEMKALFADPELAQDEDIQLLRKETYLDIDQHYVDFLNRKPDPNSLAFWKNQITEGQQSSTSDQGDVLVNVSSAFFLSTEFYESGYLVYRMFKAAFGSATGASTLGGTHMLSVPIVRLSEFVPAIQEIGQGVIEGTCEWQTQLESNKAKFMLEFVSRSRFTFAYPTSLTPAQFVDALYVNAGVTPSAAERNSVINEFGAATSTPDTSARARSLRRAAESSTLAQQEFNKAFVLMQYFGYLRRDPDDAPDTDFSGYDFWVRKLNQFNGNYVEAEMVKAFITSDEYRQRFGS